MEILVKGGRLHIEGVPDAIKLVRVDGQKARRIADLALHRIDLEFSQQCLVQINRFLGASDAIVRQALWRGAVSHYMKCFGNSVARGQLSAEKILKGESLGLEIHNYFKELRNKHIIHDENDVTQCWPSAAVNGGTKPHKVEKIITLSITADTLLEESYSNLDKLIGMSLSWVENMYEKLCSELINELEAESYQELLNRDPVFVKKPEIDSVGRARARD